MSINITVNGKFAKHCKPHPLLQDREKARKEELEERRKLRLLQVREQSKQFAQKVRNDVKEATRKENLKFEAKKAEEFNCWRHHTMQQNAKDYRAAVFQIGTAHMAAKAENKEKAEKEAKKQATYKEFRKQIAARKRNKENLQKSSGPCICNKVQKCPKEQFQCTCQSQPQFEKCEEPQKRKRDSCFSSSDSSAEDSDGLDTSSGDTLGDSSLSSCVMPSAKTTTTTATTTAATCSNRATQTSMVATSKVLQKTPAVFLDVEVGSDDSIVITAPAEIKDHHAEYNQQYSSVIRVSPRKARRTQENKQTQVTRTPSMSSEPSTEKLQEVNKTAVESTKIVSQPKAQAVREKRFTLISNLVKKQQDQTGHGEKVSPTRRQFATMDSETSPHKSKTAPMTEAALRAPVSRPSSQAKTPQVSPRKGSASSKSSQFVPGVQKRPSIAASAASANTIALGSSSSTSGRVQFYDYNSKLCKDGAPAPANVQVNRQRDTIQPTAMAQAAMENRQEQERQRDVMNRNKQIEERGQKALEREQVRRDCNELTEKLDALTRQYPKQVPTNENTPHIFADKQLRKEGKMNTAVEKLLSRPNIITCSEVNQRGEGADQNIATSTKPLNMKNLYNEINVGVAANTAHLPADDVSSDSCCSILLGYVDDQSRQVRKDLERWPSHEDNDKQQRLCNLLKRLDQMRENLVQELKNGQNVRKEQAKTNAKEENYNELIDTISKCRQEREDIMIGNIVNPQGNEKKDEDQLRQKREKLNRKSTAAGSQKSQKDARPLDEREQELLQKEAILEKKVREFYELQKQKQKAHSLAKEKQKDKNSKKHPEKIDTDDTGSENKENIDCSSLETPLEIVITVKGESKCITIPAKSKRKTPVKRKPSPRATLIKSPQPAKNLTPKKKMPASKSMPAKVLGRQNSYDSNSTSYMSLPPQIPNQLGTMLDQRQRPHSTTDDTQTSLEYDDERNSTKRVDKEQVQRINPLVAQYVQRLLGMSRHAVQRLGVSSSDIDTPSSSLINTTDNVPSQDSMASDERLACVESFMQENRSFIKELEQSLRAHNNSTLENSMKKLDDIWRKRLKQQKHQATTAESRPKTATNQTNRKPTKQTIPQPNKVTTTQEKMVTNEKTDKERRPHLNLNRPPTITSSSSILNTKKSAKERTELLESSPELNTKKSTKQSAQLFESSPEMMTKNNATEKRADKHQRPVQKLVHKSVDTRSSEDLNKSEPDSQIARYAQLTENCTHRIAELTELINRVRQEKQRLLEVTLSSVSDNGRQSTEYFELPNGKSHTTNEPETSVTSSSSDEAAKNKPSSTLGPRVHHHVPTLTALDKNRHITASRDSGIADSRPITAQENRMDIEPISHTSTESQGGMLAAPRKPKPPPTLRRFSPQFQEEDLVHELSTILEVDTPANSRINTAVGAGGQSLPEERSEPPPPAVMFPTFEEYVQQLHMDITALDVAQSTQLHHEFSQYIEGLQNSKSQNGKELHYVEFPSISVYEKNAKTDTTDNVDTVNESLAQMRINNIQPQHFPAVREYVQQQQTKTTTSPLNDDEAQLLDTESLENITDMPTNTNTDNDTASLDIEKELKRRNILKNDFRYTKSTQIFSSTAHQDAEFYNDIMATESGLDKLSTSDNNTMALLETDLKRLVSQWPMEGKNKSKQRYQAYSSTTTTTTTSTNVTGKDAKDGKSTSVEESSNELGRPLNLHEFFAREFLKHVSLSGSTNSTNSDDSLRSQFLYSLIGTLTPCTNGAATTKSGQHTLDRQKTSTPVPMLSSQTHSTPSNPSRTSSSQLFSVESRISSVHMNERSNRLQHTSEGVNGDQSSE